MIWFTLGGILDTKEQLANRRAVLKGPPTQLSCRISFLPVGEHPQTFGTKWQDSRTHYGEIGGLARRGSVASVRASPA